LRQTGEAEGLVAQFPRHGELWKGRIVPKEDIEWRDKREYILYLRHLKAYDFASKYVQRKSILDVGCGSGYGIMLLSKFASHATGIYISEEAIRYCKKRHKRKNLGFKHVKSSWIRNGLPFKDRSFDVCTSFQVIEHIHPKNVERYLWAIKRTLKKRGLLIISTPN
jgi:SAM-dependent methyltransferase